MISYRVLVPNRMVLLNKVICWNFEIMIMDSHLKMFDLDNAKERKVDVTSNRQVARKQKECQKYSGRFCGEKNSVSLAGQ